MAVNRSGNDVRSELEFQTESEEPSQRQARFVITFKTRLSEDPGNTHRGNRDSDTDQKRPYYFDYQLEPEHQICDQIFDTNVRGRWITLGKKRQKIVQGRIFVIGAPNSREAKSTRTCSIAEFTIEWAW